MDIYALNDQFQREEAIDEDITVIWTERFTKTGDTTLVVPPTEKMIATLTEGTFLGLDGSDEVMLIETALIEKGELKVTGNTLDLFLNNRIFRQLDTAHVYDPKYLNITGTKPGQIMADIVSRTCMAGDPHRTPSGNGMVDGDEQIIYGLSLGDVDASGTAIDMQVQFGPLYDVLAQIADTYQVGFSMYLEGFSGGGYILKFKTWSGRDLTSGQTDYPVVQFSPNLDSLGDLKELRSIAKYKNVAYAFAPDYPVDSGIPIWETAYAPGGAASTQFERRIIHLYNDDLTVEKMGTIAAVRQVLAQRAKDALANNNYTKVVDGEVVPQSEFKYGEHYKLGDIVELQSPSGLASKARITEYIRTRDNTGEKSYPTVSVIE